MACSGLARRWAAPRGGGGGRPGRGLRLVGDLAVQLGVGLVDVRVILAPRRELLGVEQHLLGVDEVLAVEVRQLVLGPEADGIDRAGLLAVAAEDAAQHVDLVDRREALTRRRRVRRIVVGRLDVDRPRRAGRRAQLAADAALEPVVVPVQPVPTTERGRQAPLDFWVQQRHRRLRRRGADVSRSPWPAPPDRELHQACSASRKRDDQDRGHEHVEQPERQQQPPRQLHQLVVAQARQRRPQPDEREREHDHLDQQPPRPGQQVERPGPAAEEQRRGDRRNGEHVHVLGDVVQREAKAAVLGVIASHQLLLGLGQVERRAVGLGDGGGEVQQEAERLQDDERHRVRLLVDDLADRQRAADQHHADQRQPERQLVRDHLGAAAQRAKQRVLRARRPAAKHDAVHPERADADQVQQRHRQCPGRSARSGWPADADASVRSG